MSLRILKEHLPWVAPTVVILLAATGVIDFSPNEPESALTQPISFEETEVSRTLTQSPVAVGQQGTGLAPLASGGATALPAAVVQPQAQPQPVLQVTTAAVVAPQPEPLQPVAPQPVSVDRNEVTNPVSNPAAFFEAAQARLAQDRSCVEDLRVLASDARIYFPSGGLAGEETGLAQARLLGLVAQDCPNVEIIVEGHSDPSGDPAANLRLSQQRADAVLKRLSAAGIDTSRFSAVGLGSAQPSGLKGDRPSAYYDRRVEFEIRETTRNTGNASIFRSGTLSSCALDLQQAVAQTRLFYSPRSITAPSDGLPAVLDLATKASACPDARLRVIGQYSDDIGSGETPATARLRAVALMSSLVGAGFDAEQIIIAAHSRPTVLAGQPGLSERRVDFDVIID
ncbi:OmpA family protein [Marivita hallyeonensis]|uniref:Outer membrane protein OmpA n=1 Tax=Marivita hallyeonensis TaxID=996342 RepID=A0A1M5X0H3_9RHOB|nr:OmpA family protein [Marivita hallyeonensis]SHH93028.1 Outer membrane protein OmpA [Marivita hallyeonensis]